MISTLSLFVLFSILPLWRLLLQLLVVVQHAELSMSLLRLENTKKSRKTKTVHFAVKCTPKTIGRWPEGGLGGFE